MGFALNRYQPVRAIMNIQLNAITHHFLPSRTAWLQLNRVLAWAMLLAPIFELIFRISLLHSLYADFILLLAHGALSLCLFGVPKAKGKKLSFSMHVMGFRAPDMSPRNRFLLSGYRIALPVITVCLGLVWPWFFLLAVLMVYPFLRWGVSMVQHLHVALTYALQRQRWSPNHACWIVPLYLELWVASAIL
jgi:hypothetical protein